MLLVALAIVVFGSLAGEYGGIRGWIQRGWSWFGSQGFEYLDLGRFWQILLTVGLVFWLIILFRGLRGRLGLGHVGNMPWLFFLLCAFDSCILCRWFASPDERSLHNGGFLALHRHVVAKGDFG